MRAERRGSLAQGAWVTEEDSLSPYPRLPKQGQVQMPQVALVFKGRDKVEVSCPQFSCYGAWKSAHKCARGIHNSGPPAN